MLRVPSVKKGPSMDTLFQEIENRQLDMPEIVLAFLLWPYFLVALIIRLNS